MIFLTLGDRILIMELARGSFQDENSVPSCKKYHSLAHTSKNLYASHQHKIGPAKIAEWSRALRLTARCLSSTQEWGCPNGNPFSRYWKITLNGINWLMQTFNVKLSCISICLFGYGIRPIPVNGMAHFIW